MASIRESKGDGYLVLFRFSGRQFQRALGTSCPREAESRRKRVEATLHDLSTGRLKLPPDCADVGTFILSDGQATAKPEAPQLATLGQLWASYRADSPDNSKEASTMLTEAGHFGHLLRLLKESTALPSLTSADLQRYIRERAKEPGIRGEKIKSRTIKKELATFRAVWNGYAVPHKLVKTDFRAHFGKLVFGKEKSKPRFQPFDQIKAQLPGKSAAEAKNLWDCLFLSQPELENVLEVIRLAPGAPAWLYPAALLAAHTGCRRSEFMRSEPADYDLDTGVVHFREKKKDKSKEYTYRPVSLSSRLCKVLKDYLATRPEGQFMFGEHAQNRNAVNYWLKQVLEGSQWKVIRGWHIFRHTFASLLAMKGTDQRLIDATLGAAQK